MFIFPFLSFRSFWNHICKDKEVFSFSTFNSLMFYLNWKLHFIPVFFFSPSLYCGCIC